MEPQPARPWLGLDIKHEGREPGLTAPDIVESAVGAEAAGLESVWTNEDVGYDSLAVLSAAAVRTSRIRLGTAIVNVHVRTPTLLAMAAATLDELSGGRAILGLGTGHSPWTDLAHGIPIEAPLARLRETVEIVRAALSGQRFRHDGRFVHGLDGELATTPRPALPIHIAGSRPKLIELAAACGDGLIMNVITAEYARDVAIPMFREAARRAGRDPERLEITALVTCVLDQDRATALRVAAGTLVHRLRRSTKLVDVVPERHHAEIHHLHELVRGGRRDEAIAQVTPELVGTVMNAGTIDDVRAGLARYRDAGCTRVVAVAYPRDRRSVELLIDALSPRAAVAA